jgi:transcriptional regulator with XRE-family HTH domain
MMETDRVQVGEKSREFAMWARYAMKSLGMGMTELSDLTGIQERRLRGLLRGGPAFKGAELQLIGVVLGIGMDEIFPLEMTDREVRKAYEALRETTVQVWAATSGRNPCRRGMGKTGFQRCMVQLNYCAKCLAKFP